MDVMDFLDMYSAKHKELRDTLRISYTDFIRTTNPEHKAFVQKVLQKVYDNGDIYEGQFSGGLRHGNGKYTFVNGDVYEGEFVFNNKDGIGKLTYKDKGTYYGYWKEGKREGEGVFTY